MEKFTVSGLIVITYKESAKLCCRGKEIPYKDYTPQDSLSSRKMYNTGARGVMQQGATPYGMGNQNAPLFAQMNPLQAMAMQSMFQQGGGQGQIQNPGYGTYAQMNGGMPQQPGIPPGVGQQPGQFGGFGGWPGMQGMAQGQQQQQSQIPFWLMMPGQGQNPQQGGGGKPVQ